MPGSAGARALEPIGPRPALASSVGAVNALPNLAAAPDAPNGIDAGSAPASPQADEPVTPDTTQVAKLDAPPPDRTLATAAPTQTDLPTTVSPAIVDASKRARPSTADLPRWTQTPTAAEMQAAYPPAAAKANYAASGTLECTVDQDGGLADCAIASESAPGFGAAALAVAPRFKLPTTAPSGASMVGRTVRPRIGWVSPSTHTESTSVPGEYGPAGTVAFNCRVRARGKLDNCVVVDASPRSMLAFAAAGQAALRFRAPARFAEFSRIRLIVAVISRAQPPTMVGDANAQQQSVRSMTR